MADHVVASLEELYRFEKDTWNDIYMFRGENSASYVLRPKFGRELAKGGFTKAAHEQVLLRGFERAAYPYLQSVPRDDWEWLAIAQHHGLVTRLLDWTLNPLVAAYFACESSSGGDAVIYLMKTSALPVADLNKSPFSIAADSLFYPRHSTTRIAAQSGLFTVHIDPSAPFASPSLERLVLKKELLIDLRITLRGYGIHRCSLFPGLDSVAEYVNGDYGCS